jgi:MEMO1 family protein
MTPRPPARRAALLPLLVAVGGWAALPGGTGEARPRMGHQGPSPVPIAGEGPRVVHPATFYDAGAFARGRAHMLRPNPAPDARAVVVPHHWLAGHLILSGIRDLTAGRHVDRIILVGPNHSGAGGAPVTTSDGSWATPFGVVEPDLTAVRALVAEGLAHTNPGVMTYEHSVDGLMPAIAALVPGATVVPLAIHGIREDEVRALAAALARLMDEPGKTTVIVASVDFSHYLTAEEARARDPETLEAIRNLDSARIMSFRNEHLDSPGSMATVIETVRLLGATRFELRENSVSSDIAGHSLDGATTYIHGFFRP